MIKDKQRKLEIGIVKRRDISEKAVNIAYLSIGSNLGNRKLNIEKTKYLIMCNNIFIVNISSYYETSSWPNRTFPKFLNIVLKIRTELSLQDLFVYLKKVEKIIGRKPRPRNFPRICDIDILDYNQKKFSIIIKNSDVIVPHPRMTFRNFVLFPLFEICNQWKHPVTAQKISKIISKLPLSSIRGIKVL